MLATILPGSILNSASLVWCEAGDDHAAIEISIAKRGHPATGTRAFAYPAPPHPLSSPFEHSFEPLGHSGGCLDRDRVAPAFWVKGDEDAVSFAPSANSHPKPAPLNAAIQEFYSLTTGRAPPDQRFDPAHLISIRTTILRL